MNKKKSSLEQILIVVLGVLMYLVSIGLVMSTAIGLVIGKRNMIVIDPFCGLPMISCLLVFGTVVVCQKFAETALVHLEKDRLAIVLLTSWTYIRLDDLDVKDIVSLNDQTFRRVLRSHKDCYLVAGANLPAVFRIAGFVYSRIYQIPPAPYCLISPRDDAYEKFRELYTGF